MATEAQLQKKVDTTTAAATLARTKWKNSIPGANEAKMTAKEQATVNKLEDEYASAKAARQLAERNLADFQKAAEVASSAGAPVNVADPLQAKIEAAWKQQAKRNGYPSRPRPEGWNPFN